MAGRSSQADMDAAQEEAEIENAARERIAYMAKRKKIDEKVADMEKPSKSARAASMAKTAAVAAGGSMMGALAAGGAGMRSAASSAASSVGGYAKNSSLAKLLFFYAVTIQILDAFVFSFDRKTSLVLAITMYLSLALFTALVFRKHGFNIFEGVKSFLVFAALGAVYILVPTFLYLLPDQPLFGGPSFLGWASFILKFVPFWPIYISSKVEELDADDAIPKLMHIYIYLLIFGTVVLLIWSTASDIRAGSLSAIGGRPEVVEASSVINFLSMEGAKLAKSLWKSIDIVSGVEKVLNSSGIYYYTGTVDQNEKEKVGLYIENVRPADRYFYENSPILIWADISGKSFGEEIHATPFCYIDTSGRRGVEGEVTPSVINILGLEHDSLQCTFPNMTKGTYSAKVGASFNFETWAYVTYTFVDLEIRRALEVQGKSINSEFDIPKLPVSVYTNGPMFIGMGTMVDQPIGVDVKSNNRDPVLGVTLDNKWSEGDLERVNKFVIQVPSDLKLVNCDRWYPLTEKEPNSNADGYDFYEFTREELADPRTQFKSVTCRVHIKDPAQFVAGQQKVQRTFVARAVYDYRMLKSTSFSVRE